MSSFTEMLNLPAAVRALWLKSRQDQDPVAVVIPGAPDPAVIDALATSSVTEAEGSAVLPGSASGFTQQQCAGDRSG
jgi:hypothetical protein